MAKKHLAINGFGRIGRSFFRQWLKDPRDIEVVAINDVTDPQTLAHLLAFDSVHGRLEEVNVDGDHLIVGERRIQILSLGKLEELPWAEFNIDYVLESTGKFTKRKDAEIHIKKGAKRVIISAPAEGEDITICMGINHRLYDPQKHFIISNASCTTNCLAPMAYVLHQNFRIQYGIMTTIHSYTNDQRLLDLPHKDLRRARAAALNMIPTTTGAAKAIGLVIPELKGRLHGISIRVPTPNVSLVDFTFLTEKEISVESIHRVFREAAENELRGILSYEERPLVSSDFNGDPHSCIFDATGTIVLSPHFAKVMGWYDNETGFSQRLLELLQMIASRDKN